MDNAENKSSADPQETAGIVCANPRCRGTRFAYRDKYRGEGYYRRRLVCQSCKRARYTYEIPSEWFHRLAALLGVHILNGKGRKLSHLHDQSGRAGPTSPPPDA
jgi:hypothetical protein